MSTDDLVSPLRVVSMRDPAIDWYAMQEHGVTPLVYAETRDEGSVRALPGQHPRWYVLRPLTVADCGACDSLPTEAAKLVAAFRHSVTEVHNFHGHGLALRPELPIPDGRGGTRMAWSDAGLQRIADFGGGMRLIYEIGSIAYERAAEGNGRSGAVLFTVPLFLQPVLDQIRRRLVERRETSAGIDSSAQAPTDSPTPNA